MNKPILEIAKQAGLKFPSETDLSPPEKKFAELILKECMTLFENAKVNQEDDVDYGLEEAKNIIKEHFGIE